MLIPLGRRLSTPGGSFSGVAVATLDPDKLRDFYRTVDVGARGIISVLHPTGMVLFREPSTGTPAGEVAQENPLFTATRDEFGNGLLRGPLVAGGGSYISAFRSLSKPHLLFAVSLSEDDVLAEWHGELLRSLIVLSLIGLILAIAGLLINREIRARAASDAALRENRARLYEIMDHAPILVSVKGPDGKVQFINRQLEKLMNMSRQEAAGKLLKDLAPADAAAIVTALDEEVVATKSSLQREVTYSTAEGKRTAMFVKFPLLDLAGNVESVVSFSMDLTEQRRGEMWFKAIMEHAPSAVVLKDLEGRYLFANPALEKWTGVKASDLVGSTTDALFSAEYAKQHDDFDREVIEAKAPRQREFLAPFREGIRNVLFTKFPIFDFEGNLEGIGSIGTDITDRKHVEAQLVQAQRMEAVGKLTGGIAHDFNNLLTVIIGNSEILAGELEGNERLQPLAQVTLDAAERSAGLTQRLLAFGRRQVLEPRPTDSNQLLRDMKGLIERAAGERSKVSYTLAENLWPAMVDPGQLETAIINLVVNARDAMPESGRISVETANAELDELYAQMNPDTKPGDYVMIAVTDTGTGMAPEIVARVFEPFFTTKEVGKGTGLGLPTIYGFIKQSGGHVKIYSEVGHGTVVRLYVPRADAPSIAPALPVTRSDILPGGRESILLVEDDKLVRAHTESQLVALGYRVTCAANPAEALKIAPIIGKPDLLLSDVVMPGEENGPEFAARMRKRWPDLKVLFTSGYADGAAGLADGLAEGMHFLGKPFRRKDLALKVREVLDARAPAHETV
jgi:PAS domain S-box-containing protein